MSKVESIETLEQRLAELKAQLAAVSQDDIVVGGRQFSDALLLEMLRAEAARRVGEEIQQKYAEVEAKEDDESWWETS